MTTIQHSLTAPNDRDKKHIFNFNHKPLNDDEYINARNDLVNTDHLSIYPKNEKAFADPEIDGQNYSLFSFYPSVGATPDKDGIYGMVKVRGTYKDIESCNKRSEFLIKNIDSMHSIYYGHVGKPFPITTSSKFSKDIDKVKIQEKMIEEKMSKEDKEQKEIEEIKKREEELIKQNTKPKEAEPIDQYITCKVKKAQLTWTYLSTIRKLKDIKRSILDSRDEIEHFNTIHPTLIDEYLDKYNKSLESVNITQEKDSFIKYLDEDAKNELGF